MVDLLGWGELILVLALALVIVGPKDLPKLFYALGRWVYRAKSLLGHFQEEWDRLLQEENTKAFREQAPEDNSPDLPSVPSKTSQKPKKKKSVTSKKRHHQKHPH